MHKEKSKLAATSQDRTASRLKHLAPEQPMIEHKRQEAR
jgi:hypothetical protein